MALRTPLSVTPHLYMGDSTGRPLDKGVVYFGEQDKDPEFYPINLFSDDALTKPLAQPVHTKGGYLYDKGDMVEPHAKEIIYSVKVLDSYGRKVFYKGAMMRNSWNDDVIEQINDAVFAASDEAKAIFEDAAEESKKNAQSMVNDAINSTAVEGGVLADTFVVVDGSLSQRTINKGLESIADLSTINNPKNGLRVYVKSYHAGLGKGGGYFVYDSAKNSENDGGVVVNGWVRQFEGHAVNIEWFGAIGDWHQYNQEGFDNTQYIQKAIDYITNSPLTREAGNRHLHIPDGSFRTKALYAVNDTWGLYISGTGMGSKLVFDLSEQEPVGLTSNLESIEIDNIHVIGTLEEGIKYNTLGFNNILFEGDRVYSNGNRAADIDVRFNNCFFSQFQTVAKVRGRGCTFNGGGFGAVGFIIHIEAPEDIKLPGTDPDLQEKSTIHSVRTSMRHYVVRSTRFDGVSVVIYIEQLDENVKDSYISNINNILISDNDIVNMDAFITSNKEDQENNFIGIKNVNIVNNNIMSSIAYGAIRGVADIYNLSFSNNNYFANANTQLSAVGMQNIIKCTGYMRNVTINNNNIHGGCVHVIFNTATNIGKHTNILLVNNNFAYYHSGAFVNSHIVYTTSEIDNLVILGNTFQSVVEGSTSKVYRVTSPQQPRHLTVFANNSSNFEFVDKNATYPTEVYFGSTLVSGQLNISQKSQYNYDGHRIKGIVSIVFDVPESLSGVSANDPLRLSVATEEVKASAPNVSSYFVNNIRLSYITGLGHKLADIEGVIQAKPFAHIALRDISEVEQTVAIAFSNVAGKRIAFSFDYEYAY